VAGQRLVVRLKYSRLAIGYFHFISFSFNLYQAYLNNISMLPKKYDDLAMQCETMGDANKTALHRKRKDIVEIEVNLIT
jgi:hypothetical protein